MVTHEKLQICEMTYKMSLEVVCYSNVTPEVRVEIQKVFITLKEQEFKHLKLKHCQSFVYNEIFLYRGFVLLSNQMPAVYLFKISLPTSSEHRFISEMNQHRTILSIIEKEGNIKLSHTDYSSICLDPNLVP